MDHAPYDAFARDLFSLLKHRIIRPLDLLLCIEGRMHDAHEAVRDLLRRHGKLATALKPYQRYADEDVIPLSEEALLRALLTTEAARTVCVDLPAVVDTLERREREQHHGLGSWGTLKLAAVRYHRSLQAGVTAFISDMLHRAELGSTMFAYAKRLCRPDFQKNTTLKTILLTNLNMGSHDAFSVFHGAAHIFREYCEAHGDDTVAKRVLDCLERAIELHASPPMRR